MSTPLFTVVVPTYNRPQFLREAIDSVVAQTWTDWELIVVDDGSDRPVEPIVAEFVDPRIHYLYQRNMGLALARQTGVDRAVGSLICFLDDDDYYLPRHLENFAVAFENSGRKQQLLKSGMLLLSTDGKLSRGTLFDNNLDGQLQHWLIPSGIFPYAIPREAALRIRSQEYYLTEDFNWIGRLLKELPVTQLPEFTVVFRLHDQNRTKVLLDRRAVSERVRAVTDLYHHPGVAERVPRALYRKMLSHQYLHWARWCMRRGKIREAVYGFRAGAADLDSGTARGISYTVYVFAKSMVTEPLLRNKVSRLSRQYAKQLARRASLPLVNFILRSSALAPQDALVIVAEARSGSTWLMEILSNISGVVPKFEPFQPTGGQVPGSLGWDEKPTLSGITDGKREEIAFINGVLSFSRPNLWTTAYLRARHLVHPQRALVNSVRAYRLLPYLVENAGLKRRPILLMRHPLPSCLSYLRHWPDAVWVTDWSTTSLTIQNERFYEHHDYLLSLTTKLELLVAKWCIDNVDMLRSSHILDRVIPVFYEDLVLEPAKVISRVLDDWGVTEEDRKWLQDINFSRASATDHFGEFHPDPSHQLEKSWRSTTEGERERVQLVLDHFGFRLYTCENPLPNRQFLGC